MRGLDCFHKVYISLLDIARMGVRHITNDFLSLRACNTGQHAQTSAQTEQFFLEFEQRHLLFL